ITGGRPDPANDIRPGDPVLAPGQDIFTAQLTLTGGDCPSVVRTSPVDVVLVIDVSGSMDGEPIDAVRAAARTFIDRFNLNADLQSDQIAIVTFSDNGSVISRSAPDQPYEVNTALSRSVTDLRDSLDNFLEIAGGTQLSSGLSLARQILDGAGRN